MKRKLLTLGLLTLLLTRNAQSEITCDEVVQKAQQAIQAQKSQIEVRDRELGQAEKMLADLKTENRSLKDSADAWYNSRTLWLVVGGVAAAYIVRH